MPVRHFPIGVPTSDEQTIRDRLVHEWRTPESAVAQPLILEERVGKNLREHIYVIWDDWAHMDQVRRSEIIMDACEEVYGKEEALNVTIAMGLTAAEADRMGIPWRE
jgi:hypothetical protein